MLSPIVFKYLDRRADQIEEEYEFVGKVSSIRFNDKGTAIVTVKKKEYLLFTPGIDFTHKIKVGDELIKDKNSKMYTLVKANTGDKIISN